MVSSFQINKNLLLLIRYKDYLFFVTLYEERIVIISVDIENINQYNYKFCLGSMKKINCYEIIFFKSWFRFVHFSFFSYLLCKYLRKFDIRGWAKLITNFHF